jgi:hypothetical protein
MANEAQCIETPTEFARYTIAAGAVIPIGTLLKLSDPNTVAVSSAADVFGGIAWEESTAASTETQITAAKNGVWDITASTAAITVGGLVSLSGANVVKQAVEAETVTGAIVGKALETAASGEVIRVAVGRSI